MKKKITKKKVQTVRPLPKPDKYSVEIHYTKFPGNLIRIEGFGNVLSEAEIAFEYGQPVADLYFDEACPIAMRRNYCQDGEESILIEDSEEDGPIYIHLGAIFSKDEFSELVNKMKKCGSILHEIIETNKDIRIKTVKI